MSFLLRQKLGRLLWQSTLGLPQFPEPEGFRIRRKATKQALADRNFGNIVVFQQLKLLPIQQTWVQRSHGAEYRIEQRLGNWQQMNPTITQVTNQLTERKSGRAHGFDQTWVLVVPAQGTDQFGQVVGHHGLDAGIGKTRRKRQVAQQSATDLPEHP